MATSKYSADSAPLLHPCNLFNARSGAIGAGSGTVVPNGNLAGFDNTVPLTN